MHTFTLIHRGSEYVTLPDRATVAAALQQLDDTTGVTVRERHYGPGHNEAQDVPAEQFTALHAGDTVHVFWDARRGHAYEGDALLLSERRPDCGDGLSLWDVRFVDDGIEAVRKINAANAR